MKHDTNAYDVQPSGASKAIVTPLEEVHEPMPKNLDEVRFGVVFTGKLKYHGSWWKGTFVKTGGGVASLSAPGAWFGHNDKNITVEDYKQVDIEIMVVPHVG